MQPRLVTALLSTCLLIGTTVAVSSAQAESVTERGERFDRVVEENGQRYVLLGSGVFRT